MDNTDIGIINSGKSADLLLQNFSVYIDVEFNKLTEKLVMQYRSDNSTNAEVFKMIVAEMSSIRSLKESLTREVKKANNKREQIYGNQ